MEEERERERGEEKARGEDGDGVKEVGRRTKPEQEDASTRLLGSAEGFLGRRYEGAQ